eukprot:1987809-Rhodomonas_salina.1
MDGFVLAFVASAAHSVHTHAHLHHEVDPCGPQRPTGGMVLTLSRTDVSCISCLLLQAKSHA